MSLKLETLVNKKSKYYLGNGIPKDCETDVVLDRVYHRVTKKPFNDREYINIYEKDVIENCIRMWVNTYLSNGERHRNYIRISKGLSLDMGLSRIRDNDYKRDNRYKIYIVLT